jgi:hypothetical protein
MTGWLIQLNGRDVEGSGRGLIQDASNISLLTWKYAGNRKTKVGPGPLECEALLLNTQLRLLVAHLCKVNSSGKGQSIWEDGIRMDLREIGWGRGLWIWFDWLGKETGDECYECGDEPSVSCVTELVTLKNRVKRWQLRRQQWTFVFYKSRENRSNTALLWRICFQSNILGLDPAKDLDFENDCILVCWTV